MANYLVFDWGGTFLKYALMNEKGDILEKDQFPSAFRNSTKESFYKALDNVVNSFKDISGIAISSAGVIDSAKGYVHTIGILPCLRDTNVCEELANRYHTNVTIENDGKCAALAELWLGNLKDVDDGAVIVIGTSIGGALILDHKLRRGKNFFAGEFCAMCIEMNEPEKPESYAGQRCCTPYLCELIQKKLNIKEEIQGDTAFQYINEGNEKALEALKEFTDDFAMFLFNIYVSLDLEKILIGGGISKQPVLLDYLKQSIHELKNTQHDLKHGIGYPLPVVDVCEFYNDANLVGALYHHLMESKTL